MNRRALLALALTLTSAASALQATTTGNANLRATPSTAGAVVRLLPRGTVVDEGPCTGAWCAVTAGTQRGFVSKSLLRESPTARIPALPPPSRVPALPAAGDTYTNVDGVQVQRPLMAPSAPAGASAQCRDGSYSFSTHRRGTCSHHGGVSQWL